ncbi:DUF397 domain-containing protein [Micromonospora mangrovi]|uniref:DUF397 domain-containing protein n=2 Tax=Micromonospora TaxID=1873 RepID=A0AAU8H8Y3_9ACTN
MNEVLRVAMAERGETVGVLVRDSKDASGGTLRFTPDRWRAFVTATKGR